MKQMPRARCATTNAEIDAAIKRGKEYEPYRPLVTFAEYERANDRETRQRKRNAAALRQAQDRRPRSLWMQRRKIKDGGLLALTFTVLLVMLLVLVVAFLGCHDGVVTSDLLPCPGTFEGDEP